jgi:hypothetical protein
VRLASRLLFAGVVLATSCGIPSGAAFAIWQSTAATVMIDDVYYVLPSFWEAELRPRDPLCRQYEDFHIVIVGRSLFINGVLAYQAKRYDKVYVVYPQGVIVNGRIARVKEHKVLDPSVALLCSDWG